MYAIRSYYVMSGVELDWSAPAGGGTPAGMRYDVINSMSSRSLIT